MSEIFEVVFKGVNIPTNQSVYNIFHYWADDEFVPTLADCTFLGTQAHSGVWSKAVEVLHSDYSLIDVTVTAQSNLTQAILFPGTFTQGTRSGTASPAQLVWSFKLQRTLTVTKSGGKRFSPVSREDVTPTGQGASGPIQTNLALLGGAMSQEYTDPLTGISYIPIIWGRVKNKLPVSIINPIAYAVFTEATTQKSRQRGIGN